jgi:putative DNA primase/helicase
LFLDSVIDPDVARERGYETVNRPNRVDPSDPGDTRAMLTRRGFPSWATREDYFYPGLWIPQYSPAGQQYAGQWKPFRAVPDRNGKAQRYASAKGPSRLDVHPRWSRGGGVLPPILDPDQRLWITEGVKKADALTSRGCVTVALAGVYNWRNTNATLGDWEDVQLRKREVVICFDADAITKPHVAAAMSRLGKWLRHKGAAKVWYLVVPAMVGGSAVKGVDDYLAAGGSMKDLEQALVSSPPKITDTEDRWTDARLAEVLATEALDGRYVWTPELGWLTFSGHVWSAVHETVPLESVRQWTLERFGEAAERLKRDERDAGADVDGWRALLSRNRATGVLAYSRGIVQLDVKRLDADVDHINTPSGYLELDTGHIRQLGEDEYPSRITGARFNPEARSQLWESFLERVLPDLEVRLFVQRLMGYALLGEVREHVMPIFTGTGRNGKGTLRDAVLAAFGTYGLEVDPELLMQSHNARHGTFTLELMGRRLVFCSETEKERRFAEAAMKRLVGGDQLQGNRMHKDPISFAPSHLLIMCTNHLPKVSGDDPAVWSRIRVVPFDVVIPPEEQDGRLPAKLCQPEEQEAVLAWVYAGYRMYVAEGGLHPPAVVLARTARYQRDSDLLGQFLADRVVSDVTLRIPVGRLHEAYLVWHRAEAGRDEVPLGGSEFGKAMAERGHVVSKSNGTRLYKGMALRADQDE